MPRRHENTKLHKEQVFKTLSLVGVSAFEPYGKKLIFQKNPVTL